MKKVLSLVLILLLSCSSGHSRPKGISGPTVQITNNVSLIFPQGVSDEKRAQLVEAATIHTQQFEIDWGSPITPLQVFIFSEDIKVFDCDGGPAIGCHWSPNGPVQMIMGLKLETPALYHEYVHHMIPGNDPKHTDSRWISFWEPQRNAINLRITLERSE